MKKKLHFAIYLLNLKNAGRITNAYRHGTERLKAYFKITDEDLQSLCE